MPHIVTTACVEHKYQECVAVCPVDALDLSNLLVIIDEPKCTHCDLCIPTCPVHALFFEKIKHKVVKFGAVGS